LNHPIIIITLIGLSSSLDQPEILIGQSLSTLLVSHWLKSISAIS